MGPGNVWGPHDLWNLQSDEESSSAYFMINLPRLRKLRTLFWSCFAVKLRSPGESRRSEAKRKLQRLPKIQPSDLHSWPEIILFLWRGPGSVVGAMIPEMFWTAQRKLVPRSGNIRLRPWVINKYHHTCTSQQMLFCSFAGCSLELEGIDPQPYCVKLMETPKPFPLLYPATSTLNWGSSSSLRRSVFWSSYLNPL